MNYNENPHVPRECLESNGVVESVCEAVEQVVNKVVEKLTEKILDTVENRILANLAGTLDRFLEKKHRNSDGNRPGKISPNSWNTVGQGFPYPKTPSDTSPQRYPYSEV